MTLTLARETDADLGVIEALVRKALPAAAQGAALEADTPLSRLGLTSMASVSLMLGVEGHFGIVIPDDELKPENFRTIGAVAALVSRLQGV